MEEVAGESPPPGEGGQRPATARRPPRPREDPDLLTGRGCFVDDLHRAGMLHGVFVRSPHAHARVVGVDGVDALRAGADLVLTAGDLPFRARRLLARRWHPAIRGGAPPALAEDRVRYVGEAVAFVLARDPYAIGRALGPGIHGGDELLCTLPLTPERVRRAADAVGPA